MITGYWDCNKPEDDDGGSELHFVCCCLSGRLDGKYCDVLVIRDSDIKLIPSERQYFRKVSGFIYHKEIV